MDVQRTLAELEEALLNKQRRRLCSATGWALDVSRRAGVYAIWEVRSGEAIYVGETSGLASPMNDLGRTQNHTFRRIVLDWLKPLDKSDQALSALLADRFEIAWIEVPFGRAEFEEFLILRWRKTLRNKVARRLMKSEQYSWIKEADKDHHRPNR